MVTNTAPAVGPAFKFANPAPTLVSSLPTTLGQCDVTNTSASPVYLRLYDQRTVPAPATDTPVLIVPVSGGTTSILNFGGALGKRFPNGLAFAITGAGTVTDATAAPTGVLVSGTYI